MIAYILLDLPTCWLGPIWHMPGRQARREQRQQAGDVAKASLNLQGCVGGALGWAIQSYPPLPVLCLQSAKQKLKLAFHIFFWQKPTSTKPSSSASILTI